MIKRSILLLSVFLAGCAGQQSYYGTESSILFAPESSSPYAGRRDAVGSLLNSAWHDIQVGNLESAGGTLSRAMRIKPTEPDIYYQMAVIRKEQGQVEQARQLASRALSFGPSSALERKLRSLLSSLL